MIRRLLTPVQEFMRTEAASGALLGVATLLALLAANSPLRESYEHLIHLPVRFGIGSFNVEKGISHWINDGLMAVFFLLVGLEIKREVKYGELSSVKSAMFPVIAATGGAIVPALIYTFFCHGTELQRGWAIPMATDIAFALGVLALLGSRVPGWAKIFLMALAVADDLIAVLVIALFYTQNLDLVALLCAALLLAALVVMNALGVRALAAYLIVGLFLWIAVLSSGIHATIAGVLLGFSIPAFAGGRKSEVVADELATILEGETGEDIDLTQARFTEAAHAIESISPLHRLEHILHPFVAFCIMPVFAFANAGVAIDSSALGAAASSRLALGIAAGLFVGKQIGIAGSFLILAKAGLTAIDLSLRNLRYVHGLSLLAGIGFTMSLFVGGLSFGAGPHFEEAKLAILGASLIAGVVGFAVLRGLPAVGEE